MLPSKFLDCITRCLAEHRICVQYHAITIKEDDGEHTFDTLPGLAQLALVFHSDTLKKALVHIFACPYVRWWESKLLGNGVGCTFGIQKDQT